jgi:hypothetical protein
VTLKTLRSSETSVTIYQSTRRNIPAELNLQQHRCESLIFRKIVHGFSGVVKTPGTVSSMWIHRDLRNASCGERRCSCPSLRNVKIEQGSGFVRNIVKSPPDYTRHIREDSVIHSHRLRNSNLIKVLKFCNAIKIKCWKLGFGSHSENLQHYLADYFNNCGFCKYLKGNGANVISLRFLC